MEYKYLISDIQEKTNVSITSLTAFKKKHQDFFNNNSTRIHRKIYYNQAAMDFFIDYYRPEQTAKEDNINRLAAVPEKQKAENASNSALKGSSADEPHESQLDNLKAEIDALHAEIDALRKQLNDKEAERLELLRQNGALILTLQQSQQEKMLLLPLPKKSFADKVKTFLKNHSHQE